MKLGGELELRDVEIKTSTIESRKLFLNLVLGMKPDVVSDLMRLFNMESVPMDLQVKPNPTDFSAKVFLLHTKSHHYYSIDLEKFGYKSDVRQTPVLAFFDFIFRNQEKFDELLQESEKKWKNYSPNPYQELITRSALEELIRDWKTLQSRNDSDWLCSELYRWAERWNLTDDWCLDFALNCLMKFKIELIDKCHFSDDYLESNYNSYSLWELNQFWHHGKAWNRTLFNFKDERIMDYFFTDKIPNYPKLNYVWEKETEEEILEIFSIKGYYNPLVMFPKDFRQEVEEQFWSKFFDFFSLHRKTFVGNNKLLTDELGKFQKSVDDYIKRVEEVMKPFTDETISKRDGDKHFRWLIEYQIPTVKLYSDLAKASNETIDNIKKSIRSAATILGLTNLRKAKRTGRPPGIKEVSKRGNYKYW